MMNDARQVPNVTVAEAARVGSAVARFVPATLAIVSQLLLVDAAVETFWSG